MPLLLKHQTRLMTSTRQYPQLPDGPLAIAYQALHQVYVHTSVHREAIEAIQRLFTSADVYGSHRGLALIGPSGTGKTSAVANTERWLRTHAALPAEAPSPLPMADLTAGTTPKDLITLPLSMGRDPLAERGSHGNRELRLAKVGQHLDFFGMAFDEFHHTFEHRPKNDAGKMMSVMKSIVNKVPRPIIVMGADGLDAFLDGQQDLRNRFRRRVYMRDPTVTSVEDLRDMQAVLLAMKEVLPDASDCDISSQEMMLRLLLAAESQFGSVVDLVRRGCHFAAYERAGRLEMQHLCAAYRESARRERRADEHNPLLMPIDVVKKLLLQRRAPVSS